MRAVALPCLVVLVAALAGCGVAPVRRDGTPSLPPTWRYVGPHGRPLAFGGGVCPVAGSHEHEFPPSPRGAFVPSPEGLRDARRTWPFFAPHPHHGRTCFREGWHLHLEPPAPELVFDDAKGAWRAPVSLDPTRPLDDATLGAPR